MKKTPDVRRWLLATCSLALGAAPAHAWQSTKVQLDAGGRLSYPGDAQGNRIPDYSHAGYKGGGVVLPEVPVVLTIGPIAGDNTAHIQAAIDQVAALPVQADGYRGAVRLSAGLYAVDGTIRLHTSGVVLSGVGDGADPATNTILQRSGTSTATILIAGSGTDNDFRPEVPGTRRLITTPRVSVGSRSFEVDDPSPFSVGDAVILLHPSTAAWIAAMDNGGVTDANTWRPGDLDIRYHRYVTAVSGNTIAVDAPVFNHLERSLAQSVVYRYDGAAIRRNIGIEKLLVDIVTAGPSSETHATDAIRFVGAEDSWLRDATMQHFVHSGVQFTNSTRCTVLRARALEPHSIITGERRYNFATYHAQLILFRDCYASYARHAFVTNGTTTDSGNVFLSCTSDHNLTYAEAHRRWSTGLLFDSLATTNRSSSDVYGFYNRGNYGTGHGWATGHSVIWNTDAAGGRILVQQPPTAQNYAIGSFGNVTGSGPWAGPAGYQEGTNTPGLEPASLYLAQVADRLGNAAPPDVTPPTTPTLSSSGASATSVGLSWTASADDVGVYGYDIFKNGAFAGFTAGTTVTVAGLAGSTTYAFTVRARDVAGNLSAPGNEVLVTTAPGAPVRPPIVFEAENLARTAVGASASVATETFSSGGQFASNFQYVSLGADGNPPPPGGEYVDFVLPDIPAGAYTLVMRYKTHQANRGILQLSVDGVPLGPTLNQHSSPATFRETVFGLVRFETAGSHTVRLTVTGRDATAAAYTITADVFTLRPDNTPPVVSAPPGVTVEATGPDGAVANFSGTATDVPDGELPVTFTPPSGSVFPLGSTPVTATAQDLIGNVTTVTFDVTVVDTTPPVVTVPADLVVEASATGGARVAFAVRADDLVAGEVGVSLSHDSGGFFPLGTTTVTATATDDFDNVATRSFTITVVDTTPPVLVLPPNVTIRTCQQPNIGQATASDVASAVSIMNDAPVVFTLGETIVTWRATDAAGNVATGVQRVTVELGDDASCCPAGAKVVVGTDASNVLLGTAGRDCIVGLGGNDVINALGGDDFISGGAGNDTIVAGLGHDLVMAGPGDDIVDGSLGNDTIRGEAGRDTIAAGPGSDDVDGGTDTDVCAVPPDGTDVVTRCP
jgi:chitodextrinase